MGIASVRSTVSPMSERELLIMCSMLATVRLRCEVVAEGLDQVISGLDEDLANRAVAILDHILRALDARGCDEFARRVGEYRQLDDHTLHERATNTLNSHHEFYGLSRKLMTETYEVLSPDDYDDSRRSEAKSLILRRLREICVFGDNYARYRRGVLYLVKR